MMNTVLTSRQSSEEKPVPWHIEHECNAPTVHSCQSTVVVSNQRLFSCKALGFPISRDGIFMRFCQLFHHSLIKRSVRVRTNRRLFHFEGLGLLRFQSLRSADPNPCLYGPITDALNFPGTIGPCDCGVFTEYEGGSCSQRPNDRQADVLQTRAMKQH
ncbi:hypothetical protein VTO42DRAFT_2302 [Malbranchea cinnamomea]